MMANARMSNAKRTERGRRARAGFSLIEVMISLGILAFGLLALAAVQIEALKQGSAGHHTTDAAAIGRTYLEQVQRLPWATLTNARDTGGWVSPTTATWAGTASTVNVSLAQPGGTVGVEQSYSVDWRVSNVGSNTCLLNVELRVTWNDRNALAAKNVVLATRRYNWANVGGGTC